MKHPLFFLLTWLLLFVRPLDAADTLSREPYLVGVVPQFEARRLHRIWRPVLDYLQQQTGQNFELVGSPTIPAFEEEFASGQFDFAYMNPYHSLIAFQNAGYLPLVRDVSKRLNGVLVVNKDSGIDQPGQLEGKLIAFPAPNALGASLQMRQELHDRFGISHRSKYVKTHDSVYLNVALGQADAGGGVQKTLSRQKPEIRNRLKVIHSTQPVAPHPIVVHPRVPAELARQVRDALLGLSASEQGRAMLARIPIGEIGPATVDDYLPLQDMGLERFYMRPD